MVRELISDFLDSSISQFFNSSTRINRPVRLNVQAAHCVLAAGAFMKRAGMIRCEEQHFWIDRLLGAGVQTEDDLRSWMRFSFPALNPLRWDKCRKKADEFVEAGISVFTCAFDWDDGSRVSESISTGNLQLADPLTPQPGLGSAARDAFFRKPSSCPFVIFTKGCVELDLPLFAVFNSRKPKAVSPDATWLRALRSFFQSLDCREVALAGSTGTLTYDLAVASAIRSGLSQFLVVPFPITAADREFSQVYGVRAAGLPALSCMLDAATCPGKRIPLCRDRILAALADMHLVLEIRSRGNLLAVLEYIQIKKPRPQLILESGAKNSSNAGNYALLANFPEYSVGLKPAPARAPAVQTRSIASDKEPPQFDSQMLDDIAWKDYLFHYTRSCAGPWPGQTYHQYLINLLDGHPFSGHSAFETLIRILQEGLIRASSKMIRGPKAVTSWSSHPPHEVFLIRKWNRALARWTVEPYGIAVRRDILRSFGAKPVIYGSEQVYSRLDEPDRHRFQMSRSTPSASWRHEREWRLPGDLELDRISAAGGHSTLDPPGFLFVPTKDDKAKLCLHVNSVLQILVLDCMALKKD